MSVDLYGYDVFSAVGALGRDGYPRSFVNHVRIEAASHEDAVVARAKMALGPEHAVGFDYWVAGPRVTGPQPAVGPPDVELRRFRAAWDGKKFEAVVP